MAKIMSLDGPGGGLGASKHKQCKCVRTKRGRGVKLCFVGRSKKHRSGWTFVKGGC